MFFNFLWKQVKYKKKYAKCNKMGNFLNLIFKPTNWCEKMSVSKRMIPARLFKNLQKNNQASSSWMLLVALKGVAAQGLYEITLREEFARMNELTGSLTLTSGVQARATDKSISDSLEGTVVW